MNIQALAFTILIVGSAMLGLYFCSKTSAKPSSQLVSPVKEVKHKIKYYTSNQVGGFSFYNGLFAKIEDKKYTIINGGDEGEGKCIQIFNTKDYDGDGYEDALITNVQGCGGNCCLESYFFAPIQKVENSSFLRNLAILAKTPLWKTGRGKQV